MQRNNLGKYGKAPFGVVVVHGGPGAGGEMAEVGAEIACEFGVLEPIQTAASVQGQVEELKEVLLNNADVPVALIGFSWGVWLSSLVAAKFPELVKKLILIGSGPFEAKYVREIGETRLNRLSDTLKKELENVFERLKDPKAKNSSADLLRLGGLISKADAYDLIEDRNEISEIFDLNVDIYRRVWPQADQMRKSGELMEQVKRIQCPVVAIHGDHDPHPAEGVKKPLTAALKTFKFILLENCGHKPWIEKQAKEKFYRILKEQLLNSD